MRVAYIPPADRLSALDLDEYEWNDGPPIPGSLRVDRGGEDRCVRLWLCAEETSWYSARSITVLELWHVPKLGAKPFTLCWKPAWKPDLDATDRDWARQHIFPVIDAFLDAHRAAPFANGSAMADWFRAHDPHAQPSPWGRMSGKAPA